MACQVSDAASLTRTAAIIMVGDEILSGKVADTNTHFLCQELHGIGWHVAKVCRQVCERHMRRLTPTRVAGETFDTWIELGGRV